MAHRDPFAQSNGLYLGRMQINIAGSFETDGENNPPDGGATSDSFPVGCGYVVTRTGTGTYQMEFKTKWPGLVSATATLQSTVSSDSDVQLGDYDPSTGTLVIRTLTAGADADLDGPRVNFHCTFYRKSSMLVQNS